MRKKCVPLKRCWMVVCINSERTVNYPIGGIHHESRGDAIEDYGKDQYRQDQRKGKVLAVKLAALIPEERRGR